MKKLLRRCGLLLAVALSALNSRSHADSGGVVLRQVAGAFVVTVFIAPGAPRAGPVDISVLAQDRADGQAAPDVEVFVRLRSASGMIVAGQATREASRNNLLYSASMNLPEAGRWELEVTIRHGGQGKRAISVLGQVSVAAPGPLLLSYWQILSLPWVIVTLFATNQWLKGRAASRGRRNRVAAQAATRPASGRTSTR
jgi:hypothetical protein